MRDRMIGLMLLVVLGGAVGTNVSASVPDIRSDWQRPNYDKSKIAPYDLEDPLTFADGRKLDGPDEWPVRRTEILKIFAENMFGQEPPPPEAVELEKFEEGETCGGFGLRQQYRMWFREDRTGPAVDWLVILPQKAKGPVPVFMLLNYQGNHQFLSDPQIRMPEGVWIRFAKDFKADPSTRGIFERQNGPECVFPASMILARGYGVMTACYAQVSPDPCGHPEISAWSGAFDLWPKRNESRTDNTTAIGAWAWSLSRGMDLAERILQVDATRVVATGWSRLAKAALLASARDTRFAVCVPNQTGGGGCPLAKRDYGENVATEMKKFPHWYCSAYQRYERNPAVLLTFDQHLLLATIAPRPLMVQGFDERWFDTEGEFLALRAASPVWPFLGRTALQDVPFPADFEETCMGRDLAYVRRSGWHGISAQDWVWAMDFVDRAFGCNTGSSSSRPTMP